MILRILLEDSSCKEIEVEDTSILHDNGKYILAIVEKVTRNVYHVRLPFYLMTHELMDAISSAEYLDITIYGTAKLYSCE